MMRKSLINVATFKRTLLALAWLVALSGPAALVHAAPIPFPLQIDNISVCSPTGLGGAGSCPSGTYDTHQTVIAPNGQSINKYIAVNNYGGLGGISDEHQSIFAPGTLNGNTDYIFFVGTRSTVNSDVGVVALSGGTQPTPRGRWIMNIPYADAYGFYNFPPSLLQYFGQLFLSPVGRDCPTVPDGLPEHQDQTFALNYAVAGSIVKDPTAAPGNLLMIYEGTNTCFGTTGGKRSAHFYSTTGVATSIDYGHTWPTYRYDLTPNGNLRYPLPFAQNPKQGPQAGMGALGAGVCMGNACQTLPLSDYGRYAVISPHVPLSTIMLSGQALTSTVGDAEPSAFVDDVSASSSPYLYEVHNYVPGVYNDPPLPNNPSSDLMIAQAQLGTSPLTFKKWNGTGFSENGIGGLESPIFPSGPFTACEAADQKRHSGSIDYVQDTGQYLLTFVCDSPSDPIFGVKKTKTPGAAWFFSTSRDLSNQSNWSVPQEITGSWSRFTSGCDYKGWYPTFMSLDLAPGHLTTTGYVFYLWGCTGHNTPAPGRRYSSRAFSISLKTVP